MRNMRQFMSGMKNYLVKHGEKGFDKEVERERNKVSSWTQLKYFHYCINIVYFFTVKINRIPQFGCNIRISIT